MFHYKFYSDSTITIEIDGDPPTTEVLEVLFKGEHRDEDGDMECDVCKRYLDYTPPKPFDPNSEYYAKVISVTTNAITVEAFTVDSESGVDYYQFGILNPETGEVEWLNKKEPIDLNEPVQDMIKEYTVKDENGEDKKKSLEPDTEYTIYVKVADNGGNFTAPYSFNVKTADFPSFNGLTNLPPDGEYTKEIKAGIAPIDPEMTNLKIKYSLDEYSDLNEETPNWSVISLTDTILLTNEIEHIRIKFVDDAENESNVIWHDTIEKIDLTPPEVTITAKENDNSSELATYHVAKVTITDPKSGIAPNTIVKYGWSTSDTEVPATIITTNTTNLQKESEVEFEVITPSNVKGDYYLWVLAGVQDRLENKTEQPTISGKFSIDDVIVAVENIKMLNLTPEVEDENYYVKTNGTVTISFEVDKKLSQTPKVTLNNQEVTVTKVDDLNYMTSVQVTEAYAEGALQLTISNIVSEAGKVNSKVYTNADLIEGPVVYDKTLPEFEYISKRS